MQSRDIIMRWKLLGLSVASGLAGAAVSQPSKQQLERDYQYATRRSQIENATVENQISDKTKEILQNSNPDAFIWLWLEDFRGFKSYFREYKGRWLANNRQRQ